jgi:GNAT superfamily N-acetyltransferase
MASFRELLIEYEGSLPEDLRIPDLVRELRMLQQRYAAGAFFLARLAGEPVGCVVLNSIDPATAEIKRLFVMPAARRSGAGRALMEAAIAFARDRAYARVVLDTDRKRLSSAYRLYRSLGFAECDPYGPVEYEDPTYLQLTL